MAEDLAANKVLVRRLYEEGLAKAISTSSTRSSPPTL
jgi:hypothetical protein